MVEAPSQGYKTHYALAQHNTNAMTFRCNVKSRFYLRTAKGHHARIEAEFLQYNGLIGDIRMDIYHNPSGSRNLEYDDKLRIED